MTGFVRARAQLIESAAAFCACLLASLLATGGLLRSDRFSDDALVHQYWMWQFRDPALFTDPLTADLRESSRYPGGYEALFRLASEVTDPIFFGELLGVGLMAVSGWLVWRIVRDHTNWRPAAWIAAALFLALFDIHRFYGGFPRGFVHPVVLLTVLLSMRNHRPAAAVVSAGGALFYPPAALLAVGVLVVSALRWSGGRPRVDRRHAAFAGLALALAIGAVFVPALLSGGSPRVFTADEARAFPEFGADGPLHYFVPSTVEYLRQNRSGFDLREAGSMLLLAALALLLVRRRNLRLLRAEVLALPVVSLGAYVLAQLVLFKLYLPHRYTYPLVAFFAIVVGITLLPTWTALWASARPRLAAFALLCAPLVVAAVAVFAFPLGPITPPEGLESASSAVLAAGAVALAAAAAYALRRAPRASAPAIGAALTGLALVVVMVVIPDHAARGSTCADQPVVRHLASLPKDAVIAGDPIDLTCLPGSARRAVVISTQLAPSYEVDYFRKGRARMFATLQAYYGPSTDALAELRTRYGATHLWVRRDAIEKELVEPGVRWRKGKRPYGEFVRELVRDGRPAVLDLPEACRRFVRGPNEVYDIECIAEGTM